MDMHSNNILILNRPWSNNSIFIELFNKNYELCKIKPDRKRPLVAGHLSHFTHTA